MKKYFFAGITWIKIVTFIIILFLIRIDLAGSQTLSKKDTSDVHFLNARKFFIYKVEKGETLFNISQKFKIPQEEIVQFNHEIEKSGLKTNMKLWIPAYSWNKKEVTVEKEVEVKPEKILYQIAVITSLNLPKIYTQKDSSNTYVDEPIKKEIKDNLEFVEGVLHSAEELKAEGLKVHLNIIDSEGDSILTARKLKRNKSYNLIITNENGCILKALSAFSASGNIKLLSCAPNTADLIKDNKNAFSLVPSSGTQCEQMGRFAGQYFSNSILITLKTGVQKENERTEYFRSGWSRSHSTLAINLDLSKGNDQVLENLNKGKTNIIFIPTSNEDLVSSLLNALKSKIPDYKVTVIGLPTWQYFETIEQKLFEDCDVHLFSSGFIDYNSVEVTNFRKYFRDRYYMEPTDASYQGYDAMLFAGRSFLKNGIKMFNEEKPVTTKGLYSSYSFINLKSGNAFENQNIHVFQPSKDLAVDLMEKYKMK